MFIRPGNVTGQGPLARFTPWQVSGLLAYYDPASCTSTGGLVSQLNDLSGNGNHATQSADANKPTLTSDTGKPVLSFDAGDYLTVDSLAATFTGSDKAFTVILATKPTDTAVPALVHTFFSIGSSSQASTRLHLCRIDTNKMASYRRDDASTAVNAYGDTFTCGGAISVATWVFSGTTISMYRNGTAQTGNPQAQNVGTITMDRATLGSQRGSTVTGQMTGWLGPIAIFASALGASDRSNLERLFGAYWGVSVA